MLGGLPHALVVGPARSAARVASAREGAHAAAAPGTGRPAAAAPFVVPRPADPPPLPAPAYSRAAQVSTRALRMPYAVEESKVYVKQPRMRKPLVSDVLVRLSNNDFLCVICGFQTKHLSSSIVHERMHTQVKPFKCQFCDYRSSQTGNLRKHEAVHLKCAMAERMNMYHGRTVTANTEVEGDGLRDAYDGAPSELDAPDGRVRETAALAYTPTTDAASNSAAAAVLALSNQFPVAGLSQFGPLHSRKREGTALKDEYARTVLPRTGMSYAGHPSQAQALRNPSSPLPVSPVLFNPSLTARASQPLGTRWQADPRAGLATGREPVPQVHRGAAEEGAYDSTAYRCPPIRQWSGVLTCSPTELVGTETANDVRFGSSPATGGIPTARVSGTATATLMLGMPDSICDDRQPKFTFTREVPAL